MYYTAIAVLFGFLYYFRIRVFKWILYSVVHIYCFVRSLQKNDLVKKGVHISGEFYVHEYSLTHNSVIHNVKYIHKDVTHKLKEKELITKLGNKKSIVHCNLSNKDGDIVMDLTEIFREFFMHFDSELELVHFLEYLKTHLKLKLEDDNKFVLYKNDDDFTEIQGFIHTVKGQNFKELVMN